MNYYSFDIFDTCLSRTCGTSENVFHLLAKKVLGVVDYTLEFEFVKKRKEAETVARLHSLKEDISIEDIYKIADFSSLTSYRNEEILRLEISIEQSVLIPIHINLEYINEIRNKNGSIIFISDMYLSECVLKDLLKVHGFYFPDDKIFVSSEVGLSKATGNLFSHIKNLLNIKFEDKKDTWSHLGDHILSDYLIPLKMGINAFHFQNKEYFYDRIVDEFSFNKLDYSTHARNLSKAIRTSQPDDIYYRFASTFVAPLYVPFTYWVLKKAKKLGIRRLYFLARDGYLLYEIASKSFGEYFKDIEISFLYVSRKSLYFAGLSTISSTELYRVFGNIDFYKFLYYADIAESEVNEISKPNSFLRLKGKQLFESIIQDTHFKKLVEVKWENAQLITKSYLFQEGLKPNGTKCALVDIRGSRRCQRSIRTITSVPLHAFYLELTTDSIDKEDTDDSFSAFINNKHKLLDGNLLEQYFSITPLRRTVSYNIDSNNQVLPVFEEDSNSNEYKTDVFNANLDTSLKYASAFLSLEFNNEVEAIINYSLNILSSFCKIPRFDYIKSLELLYLSDSKNDHKKFITGNVIDLFRRRCHWFEGSLVYIFGKNGHYLVLFRDRIKSTMKSILGYFNNLYRLLK